MEANQVSSLGFVTCNSAKTWHIVGAVYELTVSFYSIVYFKGQL